MTDTTTDKFYVFTATGDVKPVKEGFYNEWVGMADRLVAETTVSKYTISTMFTGLDLNWRKEIGNSPILYQTTVFTKTPDGMFKENMPEYTRQYSLLRTAQQGHMEVIREVQRAVRDEARRKRKTRTYYAVITDNIAPQPDDKQAIIVGGVSLKIIAVGRVLREVRYTAARLVEKNKSQLKSLRVHSYQWLLTYYGRSVTDAMIARYDRETECEQQSACE